ncbi:MAG: hypothetical protein CSA24_00770 [Deltaproteobacteria bacterium]|nr:MAG: hypothetical protein CSB49_00930 [Pseudomonadota bacterium]PIE66192.1 MAG: hypothetical protein CSA24_00770 [Deltaproteobacteria bacterium]
MIFDYIREKYMHLWLPSFLRHTAQNLTAPRYQGKKHLLFALCDHYEPLWGEAPDDVGERRVQAWLDHYPKMTTPFRDADGYAPRHSFFFPGEEYRPFFLDGLASLAKQGLGEVELHLHHDNDTAENLRATILEYLKTYDQHGHLSRDPDGRLRYAFIHGNWCLANAREDDVDCGVDEELPLLWETGCYVDMTFPAAPDESQPRLVNQIYWPQGDLARKRAYDFIGERARVGHVKRDRLLMLQGPLALTFKRGKVPLRLENGHITGVDPGTPERIRTWTKQNIHVAGRPDWVFVKVHTHGAPEKVADSYLHGGGAKLHRELTSRYNDGHEWVLHYVTAREMYNIAIAAMEGRIGDPAEYRDYVLPPPPIASS